MRRAATALLRERPVRRIRREVVRVLPRPGTGTWPVTVRVGGRRIGTLVATRPR